MLILDDSTTGGSQTSGGTSGAVIDFNDYGYFFYGPTKYRNGSFGQGGTCKDDNGNIYYGAGGKSISLVFYLFIY